MSASALRVLGPIAAPTAHGFWIVGAGSCWVFAFAIYVAPYARRLTRPRADG
ncbi:NnrS family protein [Caballeronia grimmiae]|uniref:NnrS family protein n=1 Tax=Caballeronia grimmiae TaxID=1071679 RepID=UPI001E5C1C73|nr:NnrS family protein [Caballeronia grimmiae]